MKTIAKCPNCKKEGMKPVKEWKYGQYIVQSYLCSCGTQFRDYSIKGKHIFTLRLQEGKGRPRYKKA